LTIDGGSDFRISGDIYGTNPTLTLDDPTFESVANWWVYFGTTVGASDLFDSGSVPASTGDSSSVNIEAANLPADNSTVYVTAWYQLAPVTGPNDNWYRQTFELINRPADIFNAGQLTDTKPCYLVATVCNSRPVTGLCTIT